MPRQRYVDERTGLQTRLLLAQGYKNEGPKEVCHAVNFITAIELRSARTSADGRPLTRKELYGRNKLFR
jgi:hypothetical protein